MPASRNRALREKENFQLFHFVQPLKMVHFLLWVRNRVGTSRRSIDRKIYLVGLRFHLYVGRLSRNGIKLVDSLQVEEGALCSTRVAPLRRGNGG